MTKLLAATEAGRSVREIQALHEGGGTPPRGASVLGSGVPAPLRELGYPLASGEARVTKGRRARTSDEPGPQASKA